MNEIDYAARVAKGAALLDEKRPGWERLIDLDTLDVRSGYSCVTAQLSGNANWLAGMRQLGLTENNGGTYIAHGFNAEDYYAEEAEERGLKGYDQADAFATLNALWKDLITTRLAAEPADG